MRISDRSSDVCSSDPCRRSPISPSRGARTARRSSRPWRTDRSQPPSSTPKNRARRASSCCPIGSAAFARLLSELVPSAGDRRPFARGAMNDFASSPELILLPAVDIASGKAVRLTQGEAGTETSYGDPVDAAAEWAKQGARWIHLVDLDRSEEHTSELQPLMRISNAVF